MEPKQIIKDCACNINSLSSVDRERFNEVIDKIREISCYDFKQFDDAVESNEYVMLFAISNHNEILPNIDTVTYVNYYSGPIQFESFDTVMMKLEKMIIIWEKEKIRNIEMVQNVCEICKYFDHDKDIVGVCCIEPKTIRRKPNSAACKHFICR